MSNDAGQVQIEEREASSPFIERIWRGQTGKPGKFLSIATSHWELVVWQEDDTHHVAIRGPETGATAVCTPEDSYSFGVIFKHGVVIPHLPMRKLVDNQLLLPRAARSSFWLHSDTWQLPTYENIDIFVHRLIKEDALRIEPLVQNSLTKPENVSTRTRQRRFLRATGLTNTAVHQIERARQATMLLKSGLSILDTVEQAGYYDQPHLTRSLKQYIGQTPAQLQSKSTLPLSFLYKTANS